MPVAQFLRRTNAKGFTLIELLVVIAIIGILSSVVLASLNTARERARTAALKAGVNEFRKLMELEYLDTGSYANLNKGWVGISTECAARGYAGAYAAKAVEACEGIRNQITNKSGTDFHTGVNTAVGLSNASQYSILVRMPSGSYYCVGSSGRSSDGNINDAIWAGAGCWGNP